MANKVQLKKSSVAARVPLTTDVDYGELALNYADGKLYYKKSDGTTIDYFPSVGYVPLLSGSYANPTWITSLDSSKLTGTIDNARLNGGTYSINITGNAATATTLQTSRNINGTAFNGSADITTATWGTARTITIGSTGKSVNGSGAVSWSLAEIGAAASSHTHDRIYDTGGTGSYLQLSSGNELEYYNSADTVQTLYINYSSTDLSSIRGPQGHIMLHAGNYSSYAQSTLVSGTNIKTVNGTSLLGSGDLTVSASTVPWTGITGMPSNIMYYQGFTLDANTMNPNATGFTYSVNAPATGPIARFSTGGGYDMWLNSSYGNGNTLYFRTRQGDAGTLNSWKALVSYGVNYDGDLYGSIFYDSNDTGYYLNPNGTSNLGGLTLAATVSTGRSGYGSGTANLVLLSESTYGRATIDFRSGVNYPSDGAQIYYETATNLSSGETSRLVIRTENDADDGILIRGGYIVVNSTTTDGGSSNPGFQTQYNGTARIYTYSDNTTEAGSFRSPIFYDSNDTGYYLDPNSSSRLNTLYTDNVYNYGWFRNWGSNGLYNQDHGNHWYSDGAYWNVAYGSTTGIRLRVTGYGGTIAGYYYGDTSLNSGLLNQNGSWKVRVNGVDTEIYDYCYTNDLRTYIMYDRNNTGYYVDANNTSNLNSVTVNGTLNATNVVKAWVNYDGVAQVIRASYNVSSVTYLGTGIYQINFSNAMPNANYSVVTGNSGSSSGESSRVLTIRGGANQSDYPNNKTTTSVTVLCGYGWSNGSFDGRQINVAIFA